MSPTLPASTHPNSVSIAVGESEGPHRRPWRSTQRNTSTPSRTSILSGLLYSGSASFRLSKCFQLFLVVTGCAGRSHVTWGTVNALMLSFLTGECIDETRKWVTDCFPLPCDRPAIPHILAF